MSFQRRLRTQEIIYNRYNVARIISVLYSYNIIRVLQGDIFLFGKFSKNTINSLLYFFINNRTVHMDQRYDSL